MMIQQIAENKWTTDNGKGTELTLVKQATGWAWGVYSQNASTRAWGINPNVGGFRGFNSLKDVERHYKAFKGIAALLTVTGVTV